MSTHRWRTDSQTSGVDACLLSSATRFSLVGLKTARIKGDAQSTWRLDAASAGPNEMINRSEVVFNYLYERERASTTSIIFRGVMVTLALVILPSQETIRARPEFDSRRESISFGLCTPLIAFLCRHAAAGCVSTFTGISACFLQPFYPPSRPRPSVSGHKAKAVTESLLMPRLNPLQVTCNTIVYGEPRCSESHAGG